MINWPQSLVSEIAEGRGIIILGAGASAGSLGADGITKPPTWKVLLTKASDLVQDANAKNFALDLVAKEQYLDAAEIVVRMCNPADFSNFIRQQFQTPGFSKSRIHELALEIDPKIVITTNYDEIYEQYCKSGRAAVAYNVCKYYEEHALNDIRSITRPILKIHGCVSDPQKIILSRTQYFRARHDYPHFYKIVDALFLTNTLLFIGTSLVDPDLQLLLENANISAPSNYPHYAVMEAGRPEQLKAALKEVHNIEPLEFTLGAYNEVTTSLEELRDAVINWRKTHP